MKKLFVFLTLLALPIFVNAAAYSVDTSFDEDSCILTVYGIHGGHEAVVSLFDENEDPIGLKTTTLSGGSYSVDFVLTYDTETTINVTVANESGTNELTKEDVVIPPCATSNRIPTIYDEEKASLTVLDSNRSFAPGDALITMMVEDPNDLVEDEEDEALVKALYDLLGADKKIIGIFIVYGVNGQDEIDIPDIENGYKLFFEFDKTIFNKYNNPQMTRLLSEDPIELEDAIKLKYDDEEEGIAVKVNGIGVYILYDEITPKNEDNIPNRKTGDNIKYYVGALVISALGIVVFKKRKKIN